MEVRKRLERLADKKRAEISALERQLIEAKAFLQGIEESIRALPRDNVPAGKLLRPGSKMARTRDAILKAGKPLHIDELLRALGEHVTAANRMSLTGSLSTYVRKGEVFTRPAPNTFGLLEQSESASEIPMEEAEEEQVVLEDEDDDVQF
jgi:hypothetical protein